MANKVLSQQGLIFGHGGIYIGILPKYLHKLPVKEGWIVLFFLGPQLTVHSAISAELTNGQAGQGKHMGVVRFLHRLYFCDNKITSALGRE